MGANGTGTAAPRAGGAPAGGPPEKEGRRKRVRNRLVVGVALIGVTVIAAGAPAILSASTELKDAQNLATLAELDQSAVALSHSLADERDEVLVHIAAGREDQTGGKGQGEHGITDTRSARVDRQIKEIRADGSASPELLRDLATVPSVRRTALTGKGSAMEAYRAYSQIIAKLQTLADELAERTPAEAARGSRGPAALGRAVEQASATRGLLLAALAVPASVSAGQVYDPITGGYVAAPVSAESEKNDQLRDELSADAQKSRVRELAALADFDQTATGEARESLTASVTGPEVTSAETYLTRLTDRPELSTEDRAVDADKVEAALSARIDQMRGVESGLGSSQVERLETMRDDEVTAFELSLALLGGCLIVAVGISTAVARTLTRPLAVVRIGAARLAAAPATEEPIRFTGRNDEFAQVVRSVNALHGELLGLSSRTRELDGDRSDLIGARQKFDVQRAELQERTAELAVQLQRLRHTVHHTFVNLSLRTLGLVERQLGVIEGLEERERDPEQLATLFKLDHMATVMRRHSENLLVLAGHDHGHGASGPVPLVDVARAAVSEIERYERVTIQSLPPHIQVAGFAADDLSHLVAELLENATSFSPPEADVQFSGWLLETGEVMLSVQDEGIGMSADRLAELNARLADPDSPQEYETPRRRTATGIESEGLGLRVAGLLAARHGVRVELREHQQGGVAAVVILPKALLPAVPRPPVPSVTRPAAAVPAETVPAADDSPALASRQEVDPLVVAAEAAIRKAEAAEAAAAAKSVPAPGRYDIGPETHERAAEDEPRTAGTDQDTFLMRLPKQPEAPVETAEDRPRVTDKGLPKRTPKIVKPAEAPTGRTGSVDAEELRRRLGGFHQGAKDGRRDVEAELTGETGATGATGEEKQDQQDQQGRTDSTGRQAPPGRTELGTEDTGGTVEEARS
ncbi:nitrate- and nitrite sensing domain-containing protein [Streptomyces sp. NPDC087850]|uniref:sensor histidine kinase n=1 Tax=Streptomyces sp. NPDC087850 TaxID=3365809 RepID=UPI00381D05D3